MIDEKLYPLLDGWQWIQQKNICELSHGKKLSDAKFPYLDVKYLRGTKEKFFIDSGEFIERGTKIILVDGKNSSEIFTAPEAGYMGSTFRALKISTNVNEDFFQYFVSTKKDFYKKNKRGSAIPHLDKNLFKSTLFPLPPPNEQQRIVDLLDKLFADLDEEKALAQGVVNGSELRRAAILHKAFSGKLTKLWREEHGITLDSRQKKFLSDVIISSKQKTNDFCSKGLKYVGLENMEKNGGQISFQAADNVKSTKNIFYAGNLLYGKLRPYLDKHGVARFDGVCSTDILVFSANEQAEIAFINYFLSLPKFIEYAVANSKGINLPRVSEKVVLNAEILLSPLDEQKEIVRSLDDLLGREQQTKDLATKTLERVELMKKSILAKAFRGELLATKRNASHIRRQ